MNISWRVENLKGLCAKKHNALFLLKHGIQTCFIKFYIIAGKNVFLEIDSLRRIGT